MPASGDWYDRFLVEDVLGQGGMATVYRVRHGTLGSHHALKVLDLPFRSIRARLIQEGQVQAQLRHPHVVAVTDLIDVDGSPGLIMEYVNGPTLEAWLRANRADAATASSIFAAILDAVGFAHRAGFIHRDLKPGNVLLELVDGRIFPKVTDFGLAKLLTGEATQHLTRTGFAMGTPGYMAPEQVRSAKDVDARADIFALGCILYELWCGEQAFAGEDVYAALERMESRRYTDPRTLRPDIPDVVVTAILGALEPDLQRRFASCEAMRAALDGVPSLESPPQMSAATQVPVGSSPGTFERPVGSADTLTLEDSELPSLEKAQGGAARRVSVVGVGLGLGAVFAAGTIAVCAGLAWWGFSGPSAEPDGVAIVAPPSPEGAEPPDSAPIPDPSAVGPAPVTPLPSPAAPLAKGVHAVNAAPVGIERAPPPPPSAAIVEAAPVEHADVVPPQQTAPDAPVVDADSRLAVGRFVMDGQVDSAWLEARGRRFGEGNVSPGSYTLHARWGAVEVEREVRVSAGKTLRVSCNATFFDCVVR